MKEYLISVQDCHIFDVHAVVINWSHSFVDIVKIPLVHTLRESWRLVLDLDELPGKKKALNTPSKRIHSLVTWCIYPENESLIYKPPFPSYTTLTHLTLHRFLLLSESKIIRVVVGD